MAEGKFSRYIPRSTGVETFDPRERIREMLSEDPTPRVGRESASRLLRSLMNSPVTLAGLMEGLARGSSFSRGPGGTIVAEYDDPSAIPRDDAHTLGDVILRRSSLPPSRLPWTMTHELGHARQGKIAGPLLPAAAGITGATLAASGSDPYSDSPFEKSAYSQGLEELMGSLSDPQSRELLRQLIGER